MCLEVPFIVHVWLSQQNELILSLRVGKPWLFWFFYLQSQLSTKTNVRACKGQLLSWWLRREVSHHHHSTSAILIPLHPLIKVVSNNTPGLHTHTYYIPELLFLRSLMPICLSLATCQNIGVELTAKFIQAVDLCAFVKTPKLLKFSIMTRTQLLGFVLGACP